MHREKNIFLILLFACPLLFNSLNGLGYICIALTVSVSFLIYALNKQAIIEINAVYLLTIAVQILISIIGIFTHTNKYALQYSVFLWLLYFVFALIFSIFITGENTPVNIRSFYNLMFICAVCLSAVNLVIGLLSLGHSDILYRFSYGIPYANSLALFLWTGFICGVYTIREMNKKSLSYMYAIAGSTLILVAFVLTYSRMMWIIAALAVLIFFLYHIKSRPRLLIYTSAAVSGIIALYAFKILPQSIIDRIDSINFSASELSERFIFYKDSLQILSENFLFGIGPGGWASRQFEFQTSISAAEYVHSSFFQFIVNWGMIGIVIFGLIIIYPLTLGALKFKTQNEIRLPVILNAIMLCHSLLDFDFEIPFVFMLFLANNLIILHYCTTTRKIHVKKSLLWIAGASAVVIISLNILILLSEALFTLGLSDYHAKRFQEAEKKLNSSCLLNPLNSNSLYIKGFVNNDQYYMTGELIFFDKAQDSFTRASSLDIGNPKYSIVKGKLFSHAGMHNEAAEQFFTLIEQQPLIVTHYELYAESLYNVWKSAQHPDALPEIAAKANEIPEMIGSARAKLDERAPLQNREPLVISKRTKDIIDELNKAMSTSISVMV